MLDNTQTLADLLQNTGATLYQHKSSTPTLDAQQNLAGRTHYAEAETLRWHKARILSSREHCSGTIFALVESVSLDWDNTRRGYRFVVFDVFGTVIERADLENTWKTADGARKAFWKWLESFDVFSYYANALHQRGTRLMRQGSDLVAAADTILRYETAEA